MLFRRSRKGNCPDSISSQGRCGEDETGLASESKSSVERADHGVFRKTVNRASEMAGPVTIQARLPEFNSQDPHKGQGENRLPEAAL